MKPIRVASSLVAAALLAACARSDRPADTLSSSGALADSAVTPPVAVTAGYDSAGAPAATATTIATDSAPAVGTYLADASGRALYMFEKDGENVSNCTGACAAAWPPLIAGSPTSTKSGVSAAKLGTATRSDSTRQATYGGMPLYRYEDDEKAGDIKGQGKFEFGGSWYLVSPDGKKVEKRR